jgi:hypothetical protein
VLPRAARPKSHADASACLLAAGEGTGYRQKPERPDEARGTVYSRLLCRECVVWLVSTPRPPTQTGNHIAGPRRTAFWARSGPVSSERSTASRRRTGRSPQRADRMHSGKTRLQAAHRRASPLTHTRSAVCLPDKTTPWNARKSPPPKHHLGELVPEAQRSPGTKYWVYCMYSTLQSRIVKIHKLGRRHFRLTVSRYC